MATKIKLSDAELEAYFEDEFEPGVHRDRAAVADIAAAVADRAAADARIREAVSAARADGVTWVEIGAALGVSHQAAMQRYR